MSSLVSKTYWYTSDMSLLNSKTYGNNMTLLVSKTYGNNMSLYEVNRGRM